jgi:hypothetical protein
MSSDYNLTIKVDILEVSVAKDGFLRGSPDPAVIVGAYALTKTGTAVFGRSVHRFTAHKPYPKSYLPEIADPIGRSVRSTIPVEIVIVTLAVEENSGNGLGALHGALELCDAIQLCPASDDGSEAVAIPQIYGDPQWVSPRRVHVLFNGIEASTMCKNDTWVGAAAWRVPAPERCRSSLFRAPLGRISQDNQWVAVVCVDADSL